MAIVNHLTFFCRLACAMLALGAVCAAADIRRAGPEFIETNRVRVALADRNVSVYQRWRGTAEWQLMCRGQLVGLLVPPERMQPYRAKYGGYYLFGKTAAIANVRAEIRDDCPTLSYRTTLDELWIDTHIRILGDSALVHVEADRSTDELVPHWQVTFHQCWAADQWWLPAMTHLLYDDPAGGAWKTISGVESRDSHRFPSFSKYCLAYRHGEERVWGGLWPPTEVRNDALAPHPDANAPSSERRASARAVRLETSVPRKIQFPPGAITGAYLNAPFVLFAETVPGGADERGVDTVGAELYGRMLNFLQNQTNGGE